MSNFKLKATHAPVTVRLVKELAALSIGTCGAADAG